MAQPKVLHIIPNLFGAGGGVFGGAERYALELARHMALVASTRLVSFGDQAQQTRVGELEIHVLGPATYVRGQRFNPLHPALLRQIGWADVVHCHQHHVLATSLTGIAGRLSGRRVFVTDHGGGGWDLSAYVSTDRWFHGFLHQSLFAQHVAGHDAAPFARVVYGGVDTELFSPDPTVAKEPLVVFVGRLLPHKGVNYLIEALPNGLRLEVIGRPYHEPYYAELQRLAAGKLVTFRHDCNDADLVLAYRRAVAVVLPSVYRTCYGEESKIPELLGQTLLEGMSCGTAAICTNVASMPEVVVDGETGFIVAPNNPGELREKLTILQSQKELAAEMGAAGRRRILERFAWPIVVQRCLSAYDGNGRP